MRIWSLNVSLPWGDRAGRESLYVNISLEAHLGLVVRFLWYLARHATQALHVGSRTIRTGASKPIF
jgi:hypothetical protein